MRRKYLLGVGLTAVLAVAAVGLPLRAADEAIDYEGLNRIRAMGMNANTSQVMDTASWLTDVYGPRLAGSANIQKAGEWAVATMKAWGLENVALEPFPADASGNNNGFPRGWSNDKFYLAAVSPQAFPIPGTPSAWTPGTNGLVKGEVVMVTETTEQDLKAKYAGGKLKGKWVITSPAPDVAAYWTAPGKRYSREDLDKLDSPDPPAELGVAAGRGAPAAGRAGAPAVSPTPQPMVPGARAGSVPAPIAPTPAAGARAGAPPAAAGAPPAAGAPAGGRGGQGGGGFNRNAFFLAEGVLGTFSTAPRGHGIYTIGGGSRTADPATLLPAISIPAEQYGRIARMIEKGVPVVVEGDIKNTYTPNPVMFNVVGEIRGTDKADEVVMLGGHFDSWHASTGATDNAAGSAAMMEAMRILKQSGVKLRRTVRIGLWNAEEEGLIGSRVYVQQHYGGAAAAPTYTPEHAKFAGYFNIDNGTGAIRGIYLQGNQAVAPIFRQWIEPFRQIGMTTVTIANTGGTDHQSFDGAGLPGFQFIQDEVEYNAMTHHTNLDSYERLQPEDMRRNATIAASFAFLAANREEKLPRKPAAAPGAGRGRGGN